MAVTVMNNMVNPQVMGDMINAKIEAQLKFTPYVKVDTSLVGVPGDTKTVPSWKYVGDADSIGENSQIDYTQMTTATSTFTVGKAGKGVTLTTEAINSGLGNPVGQAEAQLAKAIASKVDSDALAVALTASKVYDGTSAVIGYSGIVEAVGQFEDEEDGVSKVMFIHPKQETQLLKSSDFLSADKFEGGVAVKGAIGMVAGCWIKKSLKVPCINYEKDNSTGTITIVADSVDETATKFHLKHAQAECMDVLTVGDKIKALSVPYYRNPIIKLEADSAETEYTEDELPAITAFLKKDTTVNAFYNQDYDRTEITAYRYYGVAKTNDAKLVLAKFKKA